MLIEHKQLTVHGKTQVIRLQWFPSVNPSSKRNLIIGIHKSNQKINLAWLKIRDSQKTGKKREITGYSNSEQIRSKQGKNGEKWNYVENGEVENRSSRRPLIDTESGRQSRDTRSQSRDTRNGSQSRDRQQNDKSSKTAKSSSSGPTGYKNGFRTDSRSQNQTHSSSSVADSPRRQSNNKSNSEHNKSNALTWIKSHLFMLY